MRLAVPAILLAFTLAACGPPDAKVSGRTQSLAAPEAPRMEEGVAADAASVAAPAPSGEPVSPAAPTVPSGAPMLAYSYSYAIEAPPKSVRALSARHEAACAAAGPALCQVIGSEVSEDGEDSVRANLAIRAAPQWLKRFRAGIGGEAKAAGGRLTRTGVNSEDLSRQIVDTEASLRARTTLRDRLQALLATRPGRLADLIELERELARVQGEIDATQSQLTLMRTRVATSDLTIAYGSAGVLAPEGVLSPLGDAISDVVGIIAGTLAVMIRLAAVLAPWALLIGGLLWVFRKRLPKLRRRKAEEAPPPAA